MTDLRYRDATEADFPAIIALVTSAYRGDASRVGWTTEADILDGQRIDAAMLRADLEPAGSLILLAERGDALMACAHIAAQPGDDGVASAYFGMFAVSPQAQREGLGKAVLAEAERIARTRLGCTHMRMTVIDCREELIAYYVRRGYARTGIKKPFPYGDARYGLPRREDLRFEVLEKTLEPDGTP